jgi:anti-sigma factor RsiW
MTAHADLPTLVAYWLGELDEAKETELETHYLGCAECTTRLSEVEALASGIRRAFGDGRIAAVVTPAFADQLHARGLRIREYRVPLNGSVNCSVAPEDEVLLSRLPVTLEGVERLDLLISPEAGAAFVRLEDVPFDVAAGEVVLAPSIALVRQLPAHRRVMRLVSVSPAGERLLGEYTFNHSP